MHNQHVDVFLEFLNMYGNCRNFNQKEHDLLGS